MNIKEFFSKQYLFEIDRVSLHQSDKALAFFGAGLLVLGLVFKLASVYAPNLVDAKYRQKLSYLFFSIGLAELIWYGFRTQYVMFFGSHFMAFLILLVGLAWFVVLTIKIIKHYGAEKAEMEKQELKAKYLPK